MTFQRSESKAATYAAIVFALTLLVGFVAIQLDSAPVRQTSVVSSVRYVSLDSGQTQTVQFASTAQPVQADAGQLLTIPVSVRFVQPNGDASTYSTQRSLSNVEQILTQANQIWKVASVQFVLQDASVVQPDAQDIQHVFALQTGEGLPAGFIPNPTSHSANHGATVYFMGTLNGPNGFAIEPLGAAFVADSTTHSDARTVAHELGHLLGLTHVEDENDLMSSGKAGTTLTRGEIVTARAGASGLAR